MRHIATYRSDEIQEPTQLRRTRTQCGVVIEPREVRDGVLLGDLCLGGNGRDSQRGDSSRPDEGEGATGMRQDDIDAGAGTHCASEDQVNGSPGRGKRVIDDGLGKKAADISRPEVQARRVQEDEGAVALQLLPDGPEALVAGQLVPVGGVRADATAELLLREEEVDLGAGAVDVLPVGKYAEEAELAREGALCVRGQGTKVYVELTS